MSLSEEELENHQAGIKNAEEEDDTETDDDTIDENAYASLKEAAEVLKTNAVLFEFLSNPSLCRAISKRERTIIDKQVKRIDTLVDRLDAELDALGDF